MQEPCSVAHGEDIEEPPTKWQQKCGICGVLGHKRRTRQNVHSEIMLMCITNSLVPSGSISCYLMTRTPTCQLLSTKCILWHRSARNCKRAFYAFKPHPRIINMRFMDCHHPPWKLGGQEQNGLFVSLNHLTSFSAEFARGFATGIVQTLPKIAWSAVSLPLKSFPVLELSLAYRLNRSQSSRDS